MGDIVKFKSKVGKQVYKADPFFEQLEIVKQLYLEGIINKVILIADGESKCCTSSGMTIADAKNMCRDFIYNSKDYTG